MSKQQKEIIPTPGSSLFIDVGNSSIKAAYSDGKNWCYPQGSKVHTASGLVTWINRHSDKIEVIIIVSVVQKMTDALISGLKTENYRVLNIKDISADLIDYETPETLGLDRFFGCYGAVAHTRTASVVLDAGSTGTLDYMSAEFVFRGGIIIPGIKIIEETLREKIPTLPLVERELPDIWPGKSTKTSLQWGITGMYVKAIESMLDRYQKEFGDFCVMATGGDAGLLTRLLDRKIKVRPNLVFDGLKAFLNDNLTSNK